MVPIIFCEDTVASPKYEMVYWTPEVKNGIILKIHEVIVNIFDMRPIVKIFSRASDISKTFVKTYYILHVMIQVI